ncbi:MAG: hypothetical protein M3144_07900 [Actinomycetota bacterium]|nr:hypothetical protein [Actinomycetota bacterium]
MTPTDTRVGTALRQRGGTVIGAILCAAVAVGVVAEVAPALRYPPHLARLTVANPSVYHVNVEVTDSRRRSWLDLGTAGRERSKTVEELADQGPRWVFRFSYGGIPAGEVVVDRSDLATAGWRLAVPEEAIDRLRAAGFPPSAF